MTYALDTNTLSFLIKEDVIVKENARAALRKGHQLIIPKVADYEVQRGLLAARMDKRLRQYLDFRQSFSIGLIDESVWDKAIQVYASLSQQGKIIEDADLLIASFCLLNSYMLVTNNTDDFARVDGLKLVDWKKQI
jgi:tRNA(fMet)-specific endonuclease VapC